MAQRRCYLLACLLMPLASAGCASYAQGRKFDDSYVAKIRKNVTTKAQIRQNFGAPEQVSTTSNTETWTYMYSNAYGRGYAQGITMGLVKEKSDDQMLLIVFQGDVVVEFTYTK